MKSMVLMKEAGSTNKNNNMARTKNNNNYTKTNKNR